jgi:hypothetical protein
MSDRGDVRQAIGEVGVAGGRVALERHDALARVDGDRTVRESSLVVAAPHLQPTRGDGDVRAAEFEEVTPSVQVRPLPLDDVGRPHGPSPPIVFAD